MITGAAELGNTCNNILSEFTEELGYFVLHFDDFSIYLKRKPGDKSFLLDSRIILSDNTTMKDKMFSAYIIDIMYNHIDTGIHRQLLLKRNVR